MIRGTLKGKRAKRFSYPDWCRFLPEKQRRQLHSICTADFRDPENEILFLIEQRYFCLHPPVTLSGTTNLSVEPSTGGVGDLECRISEAICQEMAEMGYMLIDLDTYIPAEIRPFDKKKIHLPQVFQYLQGKGFFVSLDLEGAREKHELVFHDGHDFFLSKIDFCF